MKRLLISTLLLTTVSLTGQVNAASLILSSSDPVLDQFGPAPDLIGMTLVFDNVTGDYSIDLQTTNANPFAGSFRININLFNLDVGTTARNPSLFQDTFNEFNLGTSTAQLSLTGTNSRLLSWESGDRILLNNFPTGQPHTDGSTFFRSGVAGLPFSTAFTDEDMLGVDSQIDVLSAVPIPATVWLFGSGIFGLIGIKRRKAIHL